MTNMELLKATTKFLVKETKKEISDVIITIARTVTTTTQELINTTINSQVDIIIFQCPMIDVTQIVINPRTMLITTSITETTCTAVETIIIQMTQVSSTKKTGHAFCNASSKN